MVGDMPPVVSEAPPVVSAPAQSEPLSQTRPKTLLPVGTETTWVDDEEDMDFSIVPVFHEGMDGVEVVPLPVAEEIKVVERTRTVQEHPLRSLSPTKRHWESRESILSVPSQPGGHNKPITKPVVATQPPPIKLERRKELPAPGRVWEPATMGQSVWGARPVSSGVSLGQEQEHSKDFKKQQSRQKHQDIRLEERLPVDAPRHSKPAQPLDGLAREPAYPVRGFGMASTSSRREDEFSHSSYSRPSRGDDVRLYDSKTGEWARPPRDASSGRQQHHRQAHHEIAHEVMKPPRPAPAPAKKGIKVHLSRSIIKSDVVEASSLPETTEPPAVARFDSAVGNNKDMLTTKNSSRGNGARERPQQRKNPEPIMETPTKADLVDTWRRREPVAPPPTPASVTSTTTGSRANSRQRQPSGNSTTKGGLSISVTRKIEPAVQPPTVPTEPLVKEKKSSIQIVLTKNTSTVAPVAAPAVVIPPSTPTPEPPVTAQSHNNPSVFALPKKPTTRPGHELTHTTHSRAEALMEDIIPPLNATTLNVSVAKERKLDVDKDLGSRRQTATKDHHALPPRPTSTSNAKPSVKEGNRKEEKKPVQIVYQTPKESAEPSPSRLDLKTNWRKEPDSSQAAGPAVTSVTHGKSPKIKLIKKSSDSEMTGAPNPWKGKQIDPQRDLFG